MRIGIFAETPAANGGVFQYTITLLEMLREIETDDLFTLLHSKRTDLPIGEFSGGRWTATELPTTTMDVLRRVGGPIGDELKRRTWYLLSLLRTGSVVRQNWQHPVRSPRVENWYGQQGIDLLFFPVYNTNAFQTHIPFIATVHDLNHRIYTEFPEVRAFGEFERREYLFRNLCRYATTLVVESETGRTDLLKYYGDTGLTEDRVTVLPMLPAPTALRAVKAEDRASIRKRYGLDKPYLFYPAQFWPHKNHLRLIEALFHLRETTGLRPALALAGSNTGSLRKRTFAEAMRAANRLGVIEQVRYLGFVSDLDMAAVYAEAVGLIMPTFFGPTNIPILEAYAIGCPVITSDIDGLREQANGGAILVDPRQPESISAGIAKLLTSSEERGRLVARGRVVAATYTATHYRAILGELLSDSKARLRKPPLAASR